MPRPPLSVRQSEDALEEHQQLHDGIPPWMISGSAAWADQFFTNRHGNYIVSTIQQAERLLRVRLNWDGVYAARDSLINMLYDSEAGLDLLDICLYMCKSGGLAQQLQMILDEAGSAWTVARDPDDRYCLDRRVDSTVEAAARREMAEQSPAAAHLRSAWYHAYGRNPDPSKAYSDAIKAVEAVACRTVIPKHPRPTLGLAIAAMRDKPEKWGTVMDVDCDVDAARMMMNTIWKGQVDRHGTDDPTRSPLTQPKAEATVQIAVTLVHLFRTGAIYRVSSAGIQNSG